MRQLSSEPEAAEARSAPTRLAPTEAASAVALASRLGNRAVARALRATPRQLDGRTGIAKGELLARVGAANTLARHTVGSKCECGGIELPGGECTQCLARRLRAGGMPAPQVRRTVLARQIEAGLAPDSDLSTPSLSVCEAMPAILARLERDPSAQEKVGGLFGAHAVAADGGWIAGQLDGGARLDRGVQREMESFFDADFSGVRIHAGSGANRVARQLNAAAVTVGSHVIFAKDAYSPNTREGRRLLRHELAHVVQQGEISAIPTGLIRIAGPNELSEREAAAAADAAAAGPISRSLSRVPQAQINRTSLCEIACDAVAWGATAALAAAVAVGCATGSVVTFGGLAIPCTAAVIAAAGIAAVDAVLWSAILKDAICGVKITRDTPTAQAQTPPVDAATASAPA